ncbi:hypothetical protein [Methanobacterium alcaliphilum]|uniref:hypothetical protein n=1 Tax=Methanobacterium alcaliphilum TaxID=392018 RepID=UPI00200AC03E|nr:hypothetical protein [Methanobacterium alcaliphilum]MCK9150511.1 hypothetical protein [Methanobacterium alcaliphilum]
MRQIMVTGTEITTILTGKDALILFFGVYFTLLMNLIRKYRTFDMQLLFSANKKKKRRYKRRFAVALLIIDILPVTWLLVLYTFMIPEATGPIPIMAAAFASLSVLGFVKILHSIIATERHLQFYTAEEFEYVLSQWGRENDEDNSFKAHFISGIFYLIFFPTIAYIVSLIPL